jgi:hypothetical protein
MTFASLALSQCLETHRSCDNAESGFVPSRLVEVGRADATEIRVIETKGQNLTSQRYCALSHCWGPPSSITTQLNDKTYEEYQKGIPMEALPKTFHDAVIFTRELDCRYLWIDSLCIIQGNRDDWLREGGNMCKIYENSLVTLAAASSSSGRGGLFYESPRLELAGEDYTVFAKFDVNHRFFSFPLMNRAWVLQERLLSPRTLYFTKQELVWECRSSNVCQCSPVLGGFMHAVNGFPVNSKMQPAKTKSSASELVERWHQVVQVYSQLNLTQTTDKLMAVDGIAQYMAPIRGGRYVAGVWEDSFAVDLAWWVDMFEENRARTIDWVPSWSWVSMGLEVTWDREVVACDPELNFSVVEWPETLEGRQSAGHLRVRGFLVKTTPAEADVVVNSSPCLYEDCAEWTPSEGHTKDDEPLYCLRILRSNDRVYSLALRKVGTEDGNLFQRHGLLVYPADPEEDNDVWKSRDMTPRHKFSPRIYQKGHPQWWTDGEVCTVTII